MKNQPLFILFSLFLVFSSLNAGLKEAPYGTWETPISAAITVQKGKGRYGQFFVEGDKIYRLERRMGKTVILVTQKNKKDEEIGLGNYLPRSKVHEYGGQSFTAHGEEIYFISSDDQRLYKRTSDGKIISLTKPGTRYGDLCCTVHGIIAVAEEHTNGAVINKLVLINPENGRQEILDQGHDFYSNPTLSLDGQMIAWITWDHPNMPWDSTQLWTAQLHKGHLFLKQRVAGHLKESIFQPQWSPEGNLFFVSDRNGWWNLYRIKQSKIENVYPINAEFGLPQWLLGTTTWGFTGKGEEIICTYLLNGKWELGRLDPDKKLMESIPLGFNDYSQIKVGNGFAVMLGASPSTPRRLIRLDLETHEVKFLGSYTDINFETASFSLPVFIEFPSADGRFAYGNFYSPVNKNYKGPAGTLPPLIVISHGGPTDMADPSFNFEVQYWTTRGFAILDVNYGGSSGFGRQYRELIKGQWGIVDVEDCVNGAKFLAEMGLVDPKKMVIRGASSGGFTTLSALAFTDVFAGGASYSGVSDPELLIKDTHKFESRYLDNLIGPHPEFAYLYKERSPYLHAHQIKSPVIFFHGANDPVVPPGHAEKMKEALKNQGIETEMHIYPDEEHGFRQGKNFKDALEKELKFYLKIFKSIPERTLQEREKFAMP